MVTVAEALLAALRRHRRQRIELAILGAQMRLRAAERVPGALYGADRPCDQTVRITLEDRQRATR